MTDKVELREKAFELRDLMAQTLSDEIRFMLRTSGDLDKYIFVNEKHARDWLAQEFVTDEDYRVCRVRARKRRCCERLYAIRTFQTLKPSEFLGEKQSE